MRRNVVGVMGNSQKLQRFSDVKVTVNGITMMIPASCLTMHGTIKKRYEKAIVEAIAGLRKEVA